MPYFYYDTLFFATFIVVIAAIMKTGKNAFKSAPGAYSRILSGLGLFAGFSLFQLLGNQGIFGTASFLGDPLNRQLIEATIIIAGLISLFSGLGSWMSTLKHDRKNISGDGKRYYCLKMINQSLDRKIDFDSATDLVINHLHMYLEIPRCAAFKYSASSDMLIMTGSCGFPTASPQEVQRISVAGAGLSSSLAKMRVSRYIGNDTVFKGRQEPALMLPLGKIDRPYGAILIWLDNKNIDDDMIDFLEAVSQTTSIFISHLIAEKKNKYHQKNSRIFEEINSICNRISSVEQLVNPLYSRLHELTGAEYMSMANLDNSGQYMTCYSLSSGGRMLLEKGVNRPTANTEIESVYNHGKPVLQADATEGERFASDEGLFLSCGMKAKIACPVLVGKKVIAVIMLGHSKKGYFNKTHLHKAMHVSGLIATVLQRNHLNRIVESKDDQMIGLQKMDQGLYQGEPIDQFFNEACDVLTKKLKCTIARISLIDNDNKNLISQACTTIRGARESLKEKTRIPLSLLPWHRMVIKAEKMMMINQDDEESKMQPQETAQSLLPNIRSAILVPILLNKKVKGLISIGEVRNWSRRPFNAADLVVAKDVAAKCSANLRMKQLEIISDKNLRGIQTELSPAKDIFRKIKSPLTSIMGSIELLQSPDTPSDERMSRHHKNIMKSASRIKELTDWDTLGLVDDEHEEIESERVIG